MKKYVLKYGAIAAAIATVWMICSIAYCYATQSFEGSMVLGYASMLIAFSFIFVAVKGYRDKDKGGIISFGQAFKIGILISLIASTVYVVAWLIDYYVFLPDFMDRFAAHSIQQLQQSGATAAQIADKSKEMQEMKRLYGTFFGVVMFTYFEILPVGIIVSIITALILKRKHPQHTLATN